MTLFVGNFEVKYSGSLNLRALYRMVHDWILDKEYVESASGPDFPEILYSLNKSQPGGEEMWIWWRPEYSPQGNPFYKYVLRITFHSFRMKEVETVVKNRKVKLHKGEHKVIITALLETDYDKKFRNHPVLKYFYNIFWRRIIWRDIEKRKKDLLNDAYELQSVIKAFFGQPHFEDVSRPFMPKLGLREDQPVGP